MENDYFKGHGEMRDSEVDRPAPSDCRRSVPATLHAVLKSAVRQPTLAVSNMLDIWLSSAVVRWAAAACSNGGKHTIQWDRRPALAAYALFFSGEDVPWEKRFGAVQFPLHCCAWCVLDVSSLMFFVIFSGVLIVTVMLAVTISVGVEISVSRPKFVEDEFHGFSGKMQPSTVSRHRRCGRTSKNSAP